MPDASFDAYTIAFGIRNVTHIDSALAEAHRVLKPGGHFLCLEFSKVDDPTAVEPSTISGRSTRSRPSAKPSRTTAPSYQYLVESIRRFPPQKTSPTMITAAGFKQVKWRDITGGIVAMHSGWKR